MRRRAPRVASRLWTRRAPRHEAQFAEDAEVFATLRTIRAVERADVVMLVDRGLDRAHAAGRARVAIAEDASKPRRHRLQQVGHRGGSRGALEERSARSARSASRRSADLPSIAISALDGTRLSRLPEAVAVAVRREHAARRRRAELNEWLKRVQRRRRRPATKVGRPRAHLLRDPGGQGAAALRHLREPPRGHQPPRYHRFLLNRLRDEFGFSGATVRLEVRKSE